MAFWKRIFKSKYTGAEIDAAIGKANTVPAVTVADAGKALVVDEEGKIVAGKAGTKVEANPTLAGTEAELTGLEVEDTKYRIKKYYLHELVLTGINNTTAMEAGFAIICSKSDSFTLDTLKASVNAFGQGANKKFPVIPRKKMYRSLTNWRLYNTEFLELRSSTLCVGGFQEYYTRADANSVYDIAYTGTVTTGDMLMLQTENATLTDTVYEVL